MPAATNKADLIAVAEKEFAKLDGLMKTVSPDVARRSFEDGWSIRDVVVHRAHWIDLFLGWYRDGQAGETVYFPAKGYRWNDLKTYNAHVLADCAGVDWAAAQAEMTAAHARWTGLVSSLDEVQLYGGPMKGANNTWTAGRWAEAAAPSHYRSAAKFIRACLRAAR
ncbi:MAG: ClbS/DfsB family four-helix bundle protein [Shimia sp.]|uniref:ClbS/DfsB family four-helix bundle protein n=1 Tax=Shimia sp. TaxID=1954381 RepID=UPI0040587AE8